MKEWLLDNPNGSKDAFEKHFKAIPADVKKVCDLLPFPSLLALILLYMKIYKDRANAAVRILVICP
jgi:hypothetical protein